MSKEIEKKFCLELDELLDKYNASMDWKNVNIYVNDEDVISRKEKGEKSKFTFFLDDKKELRVVARDGDWKMKKVRASQIADEIFGIVMKLEELDQIVKSEDSLISLSFIDYITFTKNIKECIKKLKQAKNIARKAV